MWLDVACLRDCKMLCGTRCIRVSITAETAMKSCIFHTLVMLLCKCPVFALESLVPNLCELQPLIRVESASFVCLEDLSQDSSQHGIGMSSENQLFNSRCVHWFKPTTAPRSTGGMCWFYAYEISWWSGFLVTCWWLPRLGKRFLPFGVEVWNCSWVVMDCS